MSGVGLKSISKDRIVECLDKGQRTLARRVERTFPLNRKNGHFTHSVRGRVDAIFLYLSTYVHELPDSVDAVHSAEVINTICNMIREATTEAAGYVRGLAPSGGYHHLRSEAQSFNATAREFKRVERVVGQKIRTLFGLDIG